MKESEAGDVWMELIGNIVGFGWVFGCEPPHGASVVTQFQHLWWVNRASFWNRFYPGLVEELAVVSWEPAARQSMMVNSVYPLLRGAVQAAARDRFGEKLWIEQSRPEPLFIARAVGGNAFLYPVEPCVGQTLIAPASLKPDAEPASHGPHIGSRN